MSDSNKKDVFPDVVRIESSALCNFSCIHCTNGQGHPKNRSLFSKELFGILLSQFRAEKYIPRIAVLYHGGEPLMNKDLSFFIRELKTYGVSRIKIVTNASLLTENKSEELLDSGLTDVDISFDGMSPEENNSIRCGADFIRDSRNALYFIKSAINRNVNIRICNVQVLSKSDFMAEDILCRPPLYLMEAFSSVIDEISIESYPAMRWPDLEVNNMMYITHTLPTKPFEYCPNLFETMTILSDGSIVPCCFDIKGSVVFGNILDNSIFDIWNSEIMQQFRKRIRTGEMNDFCRKCVYFSGEYLIKA